MLGLGSAGRLCGHGQPAWRWGAHPLAGQPQLPHRSPGVQGSCKAPEGPGIRPPCSVLGGRGRGGGRASPGSKDQGADPRSCGGSSAALPGLNSGWGGHGALPLGLVLLLCLCGWSKVCSYRLRLDVLSLVQTDTGPSLRLLRALKRSRVPAGPHSLRAWTSGSLGA